MRVEKKSLNWLRKPSVYEYQQRINTWQKNRAKTYLKEQESLANVFLSAQNARSVLHTEQVVKSAVDRLKAEAKARLESNADKLDATLARLSKTV